MTKKTTPTPTADTPIINPLLDAYGNPSLVTAGQIIESAWGNSVVNRVLRYFPTLAALNTWTAPVGALGIVNDFIYIRHADQTWHPTAMGHRVTFRAHGGGAGQPVPANVFTTCNWIEESDEFNVFSGTTFTVPAGWAGRWRFEFCVTVSAGDTGVRQAFLQTVGARYAMDHRPEVAGGGATTHIGSASIVLGVGQTVYVNVYNTDTTGATMNSGPDTYFQGYYDGPY